VGSKYGWVGERLDGVCVWMNGRGVLTKLCKAYLHLPHLSPLTHTYTNIRCDTARWRELVSDNRIVSQSRLNQRHFRFGLRLLGLFFLLLALSRARTFSRAHSLSRARALSLFISLSLALSHVCTHESPRFPVCTLIYLPLSLSLHHPNLHPHPPHTH